MKNQTSIAQRFVTSVHWRMVVVSSVEKFGIGFLFGSLLAIVLIALAMWQSFPAFPILIFCTLVAILTGTVLTAMNWPSRSAAAIEADRQLHLDDLLSSAVLVALPSHAFAPDDFANAIVAMAGAACARHSPSEVIFRRFGIGSWGAIGLAMSVAVTLAVIPFDAAKSQATDATAGVLSTDTSDPTGFASSASFAKRASVDNDPISDGATNISSQSVQPKDQQDNAAANDLSHSQNRLSASASGSGGGIATTDHKAGASPLPDDPILRTSNAAGVAGGGGGVSKNTGQSGDTQTGTERGSGSTAGASTENRAIPQGNTAMNAALTDPSIPPEHRDLVRDFFNGK